MFTPSTKFTPEDPTEVGHDENISFEQAVDLVGRELAEQARDISLELYTKGAAWAAERGIIIADTKFEFGLVDGELVLADELFARLVPVLAGRGVATRLDPTVVRQAAGPRRISTGSTGTSSHHPRRCRPR